LNQQSLPINDDDGYDDDDDDDDGYDDDDDTCPWNTPGNILVRISSICVMITSHAFPCPLAQVVALSALSVVHTP